MVPRSPPKMSMSAPNSFGDNDTGARCLWSRSRKCFDDRARRAARQTWGRGLCTATDVTLATDRRRSQGVYSKQTPSIIHSRLSISRRSMALSALIVDA